MNFVPFKKTTLNTFLVFFTVVSLVACKKNSPKPQQGGSQGNVTPNPVTVLSLSVNSGPYNTMVVITGSGFDAAPADDKVMFNGMNATVSAAAGTTLTAIVPLGAGTGAVSVSVNGGAAVTGPVFTYEFTLMVSTLAGNLTQGANNGPGASASFDEPVDLVADASGNLYVTEFNNNQIRKIDAAGNVSTFAGDIAKGTSNGTGTAALFYRPNYITIDGSGNLYVTEAGNDDIRKITPGGVVTSITGNNNGVPVSLNLYDPQGIAIDAANNLYVDDLNSTIYQISTAMVKSAFAGSLVEGSSDGTGTAATFEYPRGLAFDGSGNLYVADTYYSLIRKITPAHVVTTIAGNGSLGAVNGTGTATSFNTPNSLAIDAAGNIYIADAGNNLIRKITKAGVVTTYAGTGTKGAANGPANQASFSFPSGVAVDAAGNVYVADQGNNLIRKIALQ